MSVTGPGLGNICFYNAYNCGGSGICCIEINPNECCQQPTNIYTYSGSGAASGLGGNPTSVFYINSDGNSLGTCNYWGCETSPSAGCCTGGPGMTGGSYGPNPVIPGKRDTTPANCTKVLPNAMKTQDGAGTWQLEKGSINMTDDEFAVLLQTFYSLSEEDRDNCAL